MYTFSIKTGKMGIELVALSFLEDSNVKAKSTWNENLFKTTLWKPLATTYVDLHPFVLQHDMILK